MSDAYESLNITHFHGHIANSVPARSSRSSKRTTNTSTHQSQTKRSNNKSPLQSQRHERCSELVKTKPNSNINLSSSNLNNNKRKRSKWCRRKTSA